MPLKLISLDQKLELFMEFIHLNLLHQKYGNQLILTLNTCPLLFLTISHPEALPWWVNLSGVKQSKITKGTVLAGLGEEKSRYIKMFF